MNVAHEIEGFGTWRERTDGVWVTRTNAGQFEARPTQGQYVVTWEDDKRTSARVIGAYPSAGAAFEAAKAYERQHTRACGCAEGCGCGCAEGKCGCAHAHPPSVPTEPCPPGAREKKPVSTGGYSKRLDFKTEKDAERFARALRRRTASPQHVFHKALYTNASWAHIDATKAATKVEWTFLSTTGHERGAARGAREEAIVIHEGPNAAGEVKIGRIERDPKLFGACMDEARKIGPIKNARKAYEVVGPELERQEQEIFVVIPLDVHFHIRCRPVMVAMGEVAGVAVVVKDVLRAGVVANASSIIVAHNHPTGACRPSKADRDLSRAIEAGCKQAGLTYIDHIVIGRKQFYSIREDRLYRA